MRNVSSAKSPVSSGYSAWVLFVLLVVYTFNFIDRQIISILAVPIKQDLRLTDTQLSLLGGLAFALFYTMLGVPIAWLADRKSRTSIITVALALWSVMTAACGFANNFLQLFILRLGVGVGEAGGVAPSYSLISDYFPPHQRAKALSIFSFGIPIGSALGILLGGVLTNYLDWRMAFVIVGLAGLALAPILKLTVDEPQRGRYEQEKPETMAPASIRDVANVLSKKPGFWGLSLGAACASMAGYGLVFWLPSFFVRSFSTEMPLFFAWLPSFLVPDNAGVLLYVSYFYGAILLVGGVIGLLAGGVIVDYLGRTRKSAYALVPALSLLASVPFFLTGVLSTKLAMVFATFLIVQALGMMWLGSVLAALQHLVPPTMRATASAIFLFINNLVGLGLGNLLVGALSDWFSKTMGEESLRYAILSVAGFYVLAGVIFLLTSTRMEKDWEKSASASAAAS